MELGQGSGSCPAPRLSLGEQADDRERPPRPRLSLCSLSRTQFSQAQQLAMATGAPLPPCSTEGYTAWQPQAATSTSLCTCNSTLHPPQCFM